MTDTIKPAAWTLPSELDAPETTRRAHLWFTNPRNTAWAPLYTRAQLDAAVAAERSTIDRLRAALRQALAALETCTPADYSTGHVIHADYDEKLCAAAEEAARAALGEKP